jgi:hypothetical protein
VIDYLTRTKTIPSKAVGNWKMIPPEAVAAIEKASDDNPSALTK